MPFLTYSFRFLFSVEDIYAPLAAPAVMSPSRD